MKTKFNAATDITPRAQDPKWKTKYTTTELKEKLEKNKRLNFIIDGMKIILMPDLHKAKNHLVFINEIEQRYLDRESEEYKKWFKDWEKRSQVEKDISNDWRYLLSLDWPEQSPKDVLWEFFENDIDCGDLATFTPFHKEHPDLKVEGRTLFEAKHFAKIILNCRENNIISSSISTDPESFPTRPKKSKLKKRREKNKRKQKERLLKQIEIDKVTLKNHKAMNELRMVCVKDYDKKRVIRLPYYKADKYVKDEAYTRAFVPKYEWKRQVRQDKNDKLYNNGLGPITSSSFPYEKSFYNGTNRKNRRHRDRGRTHNPLVEKVFVPTTYETKEIGRTEEDKPILEIVKEKRSYKSFYIEPIWEEVTINFHKYIKSNEGGIIKKVHYKKKGKYDVPVYQRTNKIWATVKIWKKTGYKKIPITYEIEKPVVKHEKRTLYLYTGENKTILNKIKEVKDSITLEGTRSPLDKK